MRGDVAQAQSLLRSVLERSKREHDFYNGARAISELINLHPAGTLFPTQDKLRLIDAYHYSYNERRGGLFDKCHNALWKIFESEGDIENLLSLFRHSSFIWRLNGREKPEARYIERLQRFRNRMMNSTRDRDYFLVRIIIVSSLPETKAFIQ